MTFEPPQPGNPHQFVVNQHVLPRASIQRFVNRSGCVECQRIGVDRSFPANPSNPIFCVQRVWNQRAEKTFGGPIELSFQAFADQLLQSNSVEVIDQDVVNAFLSLSLVRQWAASVSEKAEAILGIVGVEGEKLSEAELEILEASGALVVRHDRTMSSRDLNGIRMASLYDRCLIALREDPALWRVVRAEDGEFLVPDTFATRAAVPLSPTAVLLKEETDSLLSPDEVAAFNRSAIDGATKYYFARNLDRCPR